MRKITKGPSLTAARGKISSYRCLTDVGYKTKPQQMADGATQKLMSKGSFCSKLKPGPTRKGG